MKRRVVAIIPARGGSKGLPGKNIKRLSGLPLIAWTIKAAQQSEQVDRVVVSTDCEEIAAIAKEYGADVPFMRPAELATDSASSVDVVQHVLNMLIEKFEYLVLLQPTSPFRNSSDIDAAITLATQSDACNVVSACLSDKSPYWMYTLDSSRTISPVVNGSDRPARRQDSPPVYQLNGAIYVSFVDHFMNTRSLVDINTKALIMPMERSLDIDTEIDFKIAEYVSEAYI